MSLLHRLNPDHHAKQALAAHYLERAAEFRRNAENSDAEYWINFWTLAKGRQMTAARQTLEGCCGPSDWTAEVRRLYPLAEPLVPGPAL